VPPTGARPSDAPFPCASPPARRRSAYGGYQQSGVRQSWPAGCRVGWQEGCRLSSILAPTSDGCRGAPRCRSTEAVPGRPPSSRQGKDVGAAASRGDTLAGAGGCTPAPAGIQHASTHGRAAVITKDVVPFEPWDRSSATECRVRPETVAEAEPFPLVWRRATANFGRPPCVRFPVHRPSVMPRAGTTLVDHQPYSSHHDQDRNVAS
jgi:hypothetical protein